MRQIFSLLFVVFAGAVLAQTPAAQTTPLDPNNGPIMTFAEKVFAFGDINQGDIVEHVFTFENTGNAPLIITNVQATCGCTVPTWPKEAVAPGASGEIVVRFNSRGKMGMQNKVVTITSNAQNNPERVRITTNILAPPPPATEDGSGE